MTDVHDEYIETVKRWELLKERKLLLTTHSTHLIYGYMASDIWKKDHSGEATLFDQQQLFL